MVLVKLLKSLHIKVKAALKVVGAILAIEGALTAAGVAIPSEVLALSNALLPVLAAYLQPDVKTAPYSH